MKIHQVLYAPQEKNVWCGAACIQMLLRYHGIRPSETQRNIFRKISAGGAGGNLALMSPAINSYPNLYSETYWSPEVKLWADNQLLAFLVRQIEVGPFIVVQRPQPNASPLEMNHFRLVIGLDGGNIIMHDPWPYEDRIRGKHMKVPLHDFRDLWFAYSTNLSVLWGGIVLCRKGCSEIVLSNNTSNFEICEAEHVRIAGITDDKSIMCFAA